MGEYVWTSATIGGSITVDQAEQLAEQIVDTFGGDPVGDIAAAIEAGKHLTASGEVNYGNPEALRDFLMEAGLPYVITYAAASGVFGSGGYAFKPGEDEREFSADDDEHPTISLGEMIREHAAGRTLADVIADLSPCDASSVPPLVWATGAASQIEPAAGVPDVTADPSNAPSPDLDTNDLAHIADALDERAAGLKRDISEPMNDPAMRQAFEADRAATLETLAKVKAAMAAGKEG